MGYLFIDISFSVIGLAIFFFLIRGATRANKSIELLESINIAQNRQCLLLEKAFNEKLGIKIDEQFYYHTKAVDAVKQYTVSDFINPDNSLTESVIIKLATLYKSHRKELRDCGYETLDGIFVFSGYIDAYAAQLTERQWQDFLRIYNAEKVKED